MSQLLGWGAGFGRANHTAAGSDPRLCRDVRGGRRGGRPRERCAIRSHRCPERLSDRVAPSRLDGRLQGLEGPSSHGLPVGYGARSSCKRVQAFGDQGRSAISILGTNKWSRDRLRLRQRRIWRRQLRDALLGSRGLAVSWERRDPGFHDDNLERSTGVVGRCRGPQVSPAWIAPDRQRLKGFPGEPHGLLDRAPASGPVAPG